MKLRHVIVLFAVIALCFASLADAGRHGGRNWSDRDPGAWGWNHDDESSDDDSSDDGCEVELDEAAIFFEYNSTDADLGIQIFFDGPGWEEMEVTGPDGLVFEVENGGGLNEIGSTEVFTESAEPPLDEDNLEEAIAEFLAMFPEGEYEFEGETVDGCELEGEATLTHDLPDAVAVDLEDFPVISWVPAPAGPEIIGYEVIAEMVIEEDDEERVFVQTTSFPADVLSVTVSDEFAALAEAYEDAGILVELKGEVIAIEESGNKTITEIVIFEAEEE